MCSFFILCLNKHSSVKSEIIVTQLSNEKSLPKNETTGFCEKTVEIVYETIIKNILTLVKFRDKLIFPSLNKFISTTITETNTTLNTRVNFAADKAENFRGN